MAAHPTGCGTSCRSCSPKPGSPRAPHSSGCCLLSSLKSLINNGAYPSSDELTSPSVYCLTLCFPASGLCQADFQAGTWEGLIKGHSLGGSPAVGQGGRRLEQGSWTGAVADPGLDHRQAPATSLGCSFCAVQAADHSWCLQSTLRILVETLEGCKILAIS